MHSALLADLVLLIHALFVLFVLLGGLAVLRWPRLASFHLPAAIWGVVIEVGGCICPLTYLENHFRRMSGESGYGGTCIGHYLEPLLYPIGLTVKFQLLVALVVLSVNLVIYIHVWRRRL
jgi:hypothetical protein